MGQNISVVNVNPGGSRSALNVVPGASIPLQVKAALGTLCKIIPILVGSAGSLTINDVSAAVPYSATAVYKIGQAVTSSGTTYYCILTTTAGILPTNTTYFATTPPASTEVFSATNAQMVDGVPITLDWPFANGILVSAVTTAGQFAISYF